MRVGLNAIESLDECRGAMPECYLGEHLLGPCEGLRAQDSTRLEVPPSSKRSVTPNDYGRERARGGRGAGGQPRGEGGGPAAGRVAALPCARPTGQKEVHYSNFRIR